MQNNQEFSEESDQDEFTDEEEDTTISLDEARSLIMTKSRNEVNFHSEASEAIPISVESKLFKPRPSPLTTERKRARKQVQSFNDRIGVNVSDALLAVSGILKDQGASDKDRLSASKIVLDLHSKLLIHNHTMISQELKESPSEAMDVLKKDSLPYTTEIIDS
jgi:hypothetical protein